MGYSIPGYPNLQTSRPQGNSSQLASGDIDVENVQPSLLSKLNSIGKALGQKITIFSGYRTSAYSASVGGFSGDPHTRGIAVDSDIGSTPIGQYPGVMALMTKMGLVSGNTPDFYQGTTDPSHTQLSATGPSGEYTGKQPSSRSASRTRAPSSKNSVGAPQVPTLPASTALSGTAATIWAVAILKSINAPTNTANVSSMIGWFHNEGGGGANNPMNTTLSTSGATGSINSVGVKDYGTPSEGVSATAQTLQSGYPAIVAALKSGKGLANTSGDVASELSTWSGGGYTSITPVAPTGKIPSSLIGGSKSGYGGTRPGGDPSGSSGGSGQQDTGQGVQALFADYENEITMPRVAPSDVGVGGPFQWWLSSFTGAWNEEQGGS